MPIKSTEILGRLKHGQETIPSRRILILATSYLPLIGGAELAIKYLTDHLPEFSFDLITARNTPDLARMEKIGNVSVFRTGDTLSVFNFILPKNFLPLAIFFKAKKLLRQNNYDFVYVLQASQAGGAGWLLKKLGYLKQPLVISFQEGKDLSRQPVLTRYFQKLIIGSADYLTVLSTYLKEFIISQGISENRIFILPNGVNIPPAGPVNQALKNSFGLGDEKVIITVSRLVEKNGLADLIKAMVFLKNNCSQPFKLLIVGDAEPHITLESGLKRLTQELGLSSDVIFTGAVKNEDVSHYLSLANVFVRPSLSEGLGISFLEAMSVGLPVIATPVGGIPDFLEDGKTGLFCKVGDPEDIARKILLIFNDNSLRQSIVVNAKRLIKERYTWEIVAQKFITTYDVIVK